MKINNNTHNCCNYMSEWSVVNIYNINGRKLRNFLMYLTHNDGFKSIDNHDTAENPIAPN